MIRVLKDFSPSSFTAGFVAVLVGYTGSVAIIFAAMEAARATPAQVASWLVALGIGCCVTTVGLTLRYRTPVLTAWSTPGAALLAGSLGDYTMPEAIGAFLFSALLITLSGVTRLFERIMDRIPLALASALLAGVLLQFGLDVFVAMQDQAVLVLLMFLTYLLGKRWGGRYTIPLALLAGVLAAHLMNLFAFDEFSFRLAAPQFTMPVFSLGALISVGVPLFVVTMASQNVPGIAAIRACGYRTPVSPLITWTGLATLVLAPFGAFALNLAAITAAICMGPEAHGDKRKRYTATLSAGLFYFLLGVSGAAIGAMLLAFPAALVMAIAGLALIATIAGGLTTAMENPGYREPALITFLVTASGMTLFGIGSAFWGLVAGVLALLIMCWLRKPAGA